MTVTEPTASPEPLIAEMHSWLEANWDPELSVGDWWERLGTAGWAAPTWPAEWYGRGTDRDTANQISRILSEHGALGPPGGLGLMLAGPTIVAHGTDEQKERYLRDIVTGRKAWCQLFSEPGAGSDLAGLQTRAERDGDEWRFNGQKVWTSGGQIADLAMLIARTDPDSPKHQGISYFALEMDQPGVEVRPLRELTGRALFNEVFLDEARAPVDSVIGELNNGWAAANTTLANERAGLGAGGGGGGASMAIPGSKAGHLERRAGDFVSDPGRRGAGGAMFGAAEKLFVELARQRKARRSSHPPRSDASAHPQRDRSLHQPPDEGGEGRRQGSRARGEHGEAVDEPHRAALPRSRHEHPGSGRDPPRLRGRRS